MAKISFFLESINIGAIIGGTIGGIIVLIIAIVIVRQVLLQNKRKRGDWFAFNTTTRHIGRPNIIRAAVVISTATTTSSQPVSTEPAQAPPTSSVRSPTTQSSGICLHLQPTLESHHHRYSTSSIRHPWQVFHLQWERWKVWSSTSIPTTVCWYSCSLPYSTSSLPSSQWICISLSYRGSIYPPPGVAPYPPASGDTAYPPPDGQGPNWGTAAYPPQT